LLVGAEKEKELIFEDRPADSAAELMAFIFGQKRRSDPVDKVRLKRIDRSPIAVAEIPESLTVELIRPALRDRVHHPACWLGAHLRADGPEGHEGGLCARDECHIGVLQRGRFGAGRQTTTRLLSGEYPKYQALLPSEFSATAELAASAFAEAVKRVALVAERNTPVRLAFSAGQLVLEAGASEEAQAVEVLEAAFDGEDLQIAFNPQYLLDGIGAIDSDTARISFTSPTKPAVLTGKREREPDYRYVLMPIRSAG